LLKNLSYKKKFRYLIIGFALLLLISWQASIKKTLVLKSECSDMEQQLSMAENAPEKIAGIKNRIAEIETRIGSNQSMEVDFQDLLLEKVSGYCKLNNLVLKEFPQTHSFSQQDYLIETNTIVVEGGFIKLLKLVYSLENDFEIGKVVSVKFTTKEDFRSKQLCLSAIIYYQNIKMNRS